MASTVTTSLVVEFKSDSGDESKILKAEIDNDALGLNKGDTNFQAGDKVGYLVFKNSDVTVSPHQSTVGTIVGQGTRPYDVDEFVTFVNSRETTLPYPVHADWQTPVWYGKDLGNVTVKNESVLQVPQDDTKEPYIGVLRVKYTAQAEQWVLQSPSLVQGSDEYKAVIFIAGIAP